ncbi:hypothetical protein H1C71_021432 [Ictidomys tridecemlineatus]|nr:hypothetical protein H1C71_021432 [Ictidomys tridecemlineatus]
MAATADQGFSLFPSWLQIWGIPTARSRPKNSLECLTAPRKALNSLPQFYQTRDYKSEPNSGERRMEPSLLGSQKQRFVILRDTRPSWHTDVCWCPEFSFAVLEMELEFCAKDPTTHRALLPPVTPTAPLFSQLQGWGSTPVPQCLLPAVLSCNFHLPNSLY